MSNVATPIRPTQPPGPRIEPNKLEHTDTTYRTHDVSTCDPEFSCSIHRRSDHPMRAFPQTWCGQHNIMERLCPHGLAHPDPDDFLVRTEQVSPAHPCDGCCNPSYLNCWTPWAKAEHAWIHYRSHWGIVQEGDVFHLLHQEGPFNENTWEQVGDFASFVAAAAATQPVDL